MATAARAAVDGHVEWLVQACGKAPAPGSKRPRDDVKERVDALHTLAYEHGLSSDAIARLARLVSTGAMAPGDAGKLVMCLVPRTTIESSSVVQLMGAFSAMRANNKLKVLKWAVLVFDHVRDKRALHGLYAALFAHLDFETLRPFLCHLLFRLTRRDDIKPFRVRKLMELYHKTANEPWLVGLLQLYRDYFPDLVLLPRVANRFRKSSWRMPSRALFDAINRVHAAAAADAAADTTATAAAAAEGDTLGMDMQVSGAALTVPGGGKWGGQRKRKRVTLDIPAASTLLPVDGSAVEPQAVGVEEVNSVAQLVDHVTRIRLPAQMSAVVTNRWLQHFVSMQPDQPALLRIRHALSFFLEREFFWYDVERDVERARLLLAKLLELTRFLQETVPEIEFFVMQYAGVMTSTELLPEIMELVSWVPPMAFEELYGFLCKRLHRKLVTLAMEDKAHVLHSFGQLIANWARFDWATLLDKNADGDANPLVFNNIDTTVDHFRTLYEVVRYVDKFAVLALHTHDAHPVLMHAAVSFFERVSTFGAQFDLPFVLLPSRELVKLALLSRTALGVSRMAGVFAQYKAEFAALRHEKLVRDEARSKGTPVEPTPKLSFRNGLETIKTFNSFILGYCNALWREKAFDANGNPLVHPAGVAALSALAPQRTLAITRTTPFAAHVFRHLEAEAARDVTGDVAVHPRALKAAHRDRRTAYLEYLRRAGFVGMHEFMFTFMSSLVTQRNATPATASK